MIAGSMYLRSALEHSPTNKDNITQWICHESPTWNQGNGGGFPTGVSSCNDYPYFNGAIHFPHCWNGKNYNAAKPYAHTSYPVGDIQNGPCPDSHPIRLPHIMMENDFDLSGIQGQFQENSFVLANGDPTGFGWHADFVSLTISAISQCTNRSSTMVGKLVSFTTFSADLQPVHPTTSATALV